MQDKTINFPFGNVQVIPIGATGTIEIAPGNQMVIVDGVTTQATGNTTLNVVLDGVRPGGMMLVARKSAATQTLTFGTGITAPVITGVAGKTINQLFIFNGTAFVAAGDKIQID